jgi:hydrogenase maturation protease
MKTLVLGLGNPVLSDDGVGIRIARRLEDRVDQREVTVMEASQAGLSILDLLAGYDRAIIVDAVQTVGGEAGQVHHFSPEVLDTFSEECTAQVREAIPVCVEMIIEELNRHQDA